MSVIYQCRHHDQQEHSNYSVSWLYCGCDGTTHLSCQRLLPPPSTERPVNWPIYLAWKTS
jgi:hypothetical protein